LTKKKLITEKCLSMLIREEVNRDQIKIFRKIDLNNHEEIILSSEFMELDLDEFKLLFNKTAWEVVEDLFEKNRHFFVCNICRENCDTNNKHVMCMKCYFYFHLNCLGRRTNFKNLTCDACILYKERNKLP